MGSPSHMLGSFDCMLNWNEPLALRSRKELPMTPFQAGYKPVAMTQWFGKVTVGNCASIACALDPWLSSHKKPGNAVASTALAARMWDR